MSEREEYGSECAVRKRAFCQLIDHLSKEFLMTSSGAMTKEERDRLSNECAAKLLEEGDIEGAAKIFERLMSPECKAILHGNSTPHFGNGLLPDDDW